ncbi:unnamed protein product, partial [Closterium sp. NIES-53]
MASPPVPPPVPPAAPPLAPPLMQQPLKRSSPPVPTFSAPPSRTSGDPAEPLPKPPSEPSYEPRSWPSIPEPHRPSHANPLPASAQPSCAQSAAPSASPLPAALAALLGMTRGTDPLQFMGIERRRNDLLLAAASARSTCSVPSVNCPSQSNLVSQISSHPSDSLSSHPFNSLPAAPSASFPCLPRSASAPAGSWEGGTATGTATATAAAATGKREGEAAGSEGERGAGAGWVARTPREEDINEWLAKVLGPGGLQARGGGMQRREQEEMAKVLGPGGLQAQGTAGGAGMQPREPAVAGNARGQEAQQNAPTAGSGGGWGQGGGRARDGVRAEQSGEGRRGGSGWGGGLLAGSIQLLAASQGLRASPGVNANSGVDSGLNAGQGAGLDEGVSLAGAVLSRHAAAGAGGVSGGTGELTFGSLGAVGLGAVGNDVMMGGRDAMAAAAVVQGVYRQALLDRYMQEQQASRLHTAMPTVSAAAAAAAGGAGGAGAAAAAAAAAGGGVFPACASGSGSASASSSAAARVCAGNSAGNSVANAAGNRAVNAAASSAASAHVLRQLKRQLSAAGAAAAVALHASAALPLPERATADASGCESAPLWDDDDYEYSNDDSNDDDDDDTFSISSSEDLTTEVEDLKRDASSKKFSPSADEASAAPASVLTFRNICYSVSVKQRKGEPSTVGPQFTRQDSTLANFAGLPPQPGIQEPPVSAAAAVQADGGATGGGGIADGFRRKRVRRQILTGVNGEARSGEVTAIMGASGGGKTTLLNILAQRISSGRRRGTVELDAAEVCAGTMRRVSAYVMQDDVLFPSLTVRETLMYAAELRLEPRFSRREKEEKVARLIDMLGLAKVENSPIGGETKRGVSGGERKRVAIGVEMVSDPKILFLDEPTSGLDSTSAYRVVRAMKSVAIQTTSICMMVIHQPSYRVLCVIDKLLLLGVGQTAYLGPPAGLPHFLASLGSPVPEGSNSTEHGLDVMAVLQAQGVTDIQAYAQACQEGVADPVAAAQKPLEAPHDTVDPKSSKEMSACGRVGNEEETKGREFANGWFRELWVLTRRATTNIMRTPALYLLRLALILIAGLLLAILFWRPAETPEGLIIRLSFLSCACCIVFFTSCDAVPIFIEESAIFVRESANNAYRPSTYLVSSTLVYLPLHFLMALLLTAVSWWSISLAGGAEGFLFMVVAFFVMFFTANAIATCVSICVKDVVLAYATAIAIMSYFYLVSGYYVTRKQMTMTLIWLHYISPFKYAYEALAINQFD